MTPQTNSQVTTYTAAQVHATIAILAVEYMKEWKLNLADEEVIRRKALMEELGFTSSSSYSQLEPKVEMANKRKCFDWYSENFPGCIFLKTSDFMDLLMKYNLTCGRFSNYTGTVPYENLMEIKNVRDTLLQLPEAKRYCNVINKDNILHKLYVETTMDLYRNGRLLQRDVLFHSALYCHINRMNGYKLEERNHRYTYYHNDKKITKEQYDYLIEIYNRFPFDKINMKYDDLFIAAPPQEMKSDLLSEIQAKDPIVFQLFPYGVVIYSKWGEEANDPIFNE